ncbi:amidohydrolase [Novosphingobium sp. 1949]|uniref:Amidohydrolase n=1 Tax=Novosphingobium organovorum TaxID=2930092 RepID=A0ABT0BGW5_9SPHN|nr:amidohydrolase [Novosphingobium organovorum]MCJ2184277.1 amidohydrolase [Novosphingobium organovorum]
MLPSSLPSRLRALALGAAALIVPLAAPASAKPIPGVPADLERAVDSAVSAVTPDVIAWRRDIHAHPGLGNHETRTAALVARQLRALGFDDVRTGIAHTGVVGILRGARPGPVVALRAELDALPIKEATGLPFASHVVVDVDGKPTPVMHACGHDAHTAILLGAARVLAGLRDRIAGTVMVVFQPAEEGVTGETYGAALMVQEGVFDTLRPDAIMALHVEPGPVGRIMVRPGPFLSSSSAIHIRLKGRQTHAGRPWEGTDLVNLSADVVKALTTISARRVDVFQFPNVVSIGALQAGNRNNVLPGSASLDGTIRTFSLARRDALKTMIRQSVEGLTATYDAQADVSFEDQALVTSSEPALLARMRPALDAAAGPAGVDANALLRGAAEDFSAFETQVPGLYYILGSTPNYTAMDAAPSNHSDKFDIDEAVLPIGVKAQVLTALSFLGQGAASLETRPVETK